MLPLDTSIYYNEGENIFGDNDSVTNDIGALMGSYMKLPEVTIDANNINNYIVYNSGSKDVTVTDDGAFSFPTGATNMVVGKSEFKETFEVGNAVEGLYDINNYTTYTNSALADRIVVDSENETISFDSQTRNWIAGTDDMTAFKASATIQGNSKGTIYAGFGFHMQADDFATETFKYSTSGYTVIVKRSTTSSTVEILVRYISGTTVYDETVNKITATELIGTEVDEAVNLTVWADNKNFYVVATNANGSKSTGTYTYPLNYTSVGGKNINWTSGGFMLTANGVNTITDFELYNATVNNADTSVLTKATDLDASAEFTFGSNSTNQSGFDLRVQSAANASPGLTGYALKLNQTADKNTMTLQLTRYGTNSSGDVNKNLGNMDTSSAFTVSEGDTAEGTTLVLIAKIRDNMLTATVTDINGNVLLDSMEFDLSVSSTTSDVSYNAYYENGGYGFFKNGNGTVTVNNIEFTQIAKDVEKLDTSLYTLYAPEGSTGLTVEDKAFVSTEAVTQKAMVTDVNVHNFNADAVFEIGNDGNLKAGIVFRAQNIGNSADEIEGYSVVLWKSEAGTGNYSRIVALLYKWGRDADGNIVYLGEVGRLDADTTTLASVYPDTKNMLLASAGIKLKLNLAVVNDKVTFSFDVLNELNDVAASSASKTVDLSSKTFTKEANATVYNAGAIGLSIGSKGKICDFNYTAEEGYEISDIKGYKTYSNDENSLVLDSTDNKIYSTTKNFKQAVLTGSNVSEFTASATLKSTTAGVYYNMGFDFMINEETHSGYAYNNSHVSYGYEGYRLVLVRNANDSENPAGTTLYLFQFAKNDDGSYTRTQLKSVPHSTFFSDHTTEDTTDAEYASVEVNLEIKVENGVVTATATMCEHTDKVITLTYNGVEGSGAVGWYIAQGGSINNLSVKEDIADTLISAADCVNGSVHAATNAGGTASGDEVKIVTIPAEGYCVHDVYTTVNGVNTDIEKSENGFVFAKKGGATEISATFFKFGDIDEDGNVNGSDIVCLRKELLKLEDYKDTYTDVNGDEAVNVKDLVRIKKIAVEITE